MAGDNHSKRPAEYLTPAGVPQKETSGRGKNSSISGTTITPAQDQNTGIYLKENIIVVQRTTISKNMVVLT